MKKKLLSSTPWRKIDLKFQEGQKYIVTSDLLAHERTLVVTFFPTTEPKEQPEQAEFRIFLNQDDYITEYPHKSRQWKTGRLETLLPYGFEKNTMALTEEEGKEINCFLQAEGNPVVNIVEYQRKIMKSRYMKKEDTEEEQIAQELKDLPPLPDDFATWVENEAMIESRYIFYQYQSGKKEQQGYCTHCKEDVIIKARHNDLGECPSCHSKVQFKTVSRTKNVIDTQEVAILQKFKVAFVVRYFSVSKIYKNYKDTQLDLREIWREVHPVDSSIPKVYVFRKHPTLDKSRWFRGDKHSFYYGSSTVYLKNVAEVLKGTKYQYCALGEFLGRNQHVCVHRYLAKYQQYPCIEYLVKLKLDRLANDLIYGHFFRCNILMEGKNLKEILGVGKDKVPLLQKLNVSEAELAVVQEMEKYGLNLKAEDLRRIFTLIRPTHAKQLFELTEYATIHKILNYISAQQNRNAFALWKDYLGAAKTLSYPLENAFTLFPRELEQAHDLATSRVTEKLRTEGRANRKALEEKTLAYLKELNDQYYFEKGNFFIMAPEKLLDLVREGSMLKHCVGGTYVEHMAAGDTVILFLREKERPTKPYYTIEILEGNINQCHGYNHSPPTEEVDEFLDAFTQQKLNHYEEAG
ncbi:MAG: PcfJ domain-containing protein [Eubacteriales bacterium]